MTRIIKRSEAYMEYNKIMEQYREQMTILLDEARYTAGEPVCDVMDKILENERETLELLKKFYSECLEVYETQNSRGTAQRLKRANITDMISQYKPKDDANNHAG